MKIKLLGCALLLGAVFLAKPALALHDVSDTTLDILNDADEGRGIAVSEDGNIYVVGTTEGGLSAVGGWVGKFNSSMVLLASATFAPNTCEFHGITVDAQGNAYVIGTLTVPGHVRDIVIAKYNSALQLQSSTTITGMDPTPDRGEAITMDATKTNIYVTGSTNDGLLDNIWVGKFDTNLAPLFSTAFVVPAEEGTGTGITVDSSNNVFVTAELNSENLWLGKFTSSLVFVSSAAPAANTTLRALTHDSAGNIFVTGNGLSSFYIGKFNNDLVEVTHTELITGLDSTGYGITVDQSGNVFMVGQLDDGASQAGWIGHFNSSLVLQSTDTFRGTDSSNGSGTEAFYGITVNRSGEIFVGGTLENMAPTGLDIWIGQFATHQVIPPSSPSSLRAYPNPFIPGESATNNLTFDHLPAGASVKIFTLTGALVKELTATDAGIATWEGVLNQSGEKVASGVYYVFAEGNGSKKTTKVAIER